MSNRQSWWLWPLLVLLVAAVLAGLWWSRDLRAISRAALFIPQVLPDAPMRPLEWRTARPTRDSVRFATPTGEGVADLYRPGTRGPFPAIVLFLGVAPAGPDDPRVVGLGEALARSGFLTLLYWSPTMQDRRIVPDDVHNLVSAFEYLAARQDVDRERVGFAGFCVGASFALIAAAQPAIADRVAFVNAFGPYFSLRDLGQAIASHTAFDELAERPWPVDPLASSVFRRLLLDSVSDEDLREQISGALERNDDEPIGLVAPASAVFRLLRGLPRNEAEKELQRLPDSILEQMELVSPRRYVTKLRAPLLLMHGVSDQLVPVEESRRLAAAMSQRSQLRYTEFALFEHMDPTKPLDLLTYAGEIWKLTGHLAAIMRVAE